MKKKRGRPRLYNETMRPIPITMTRAHIHKLRQLAEARGTSSAQVVRDLIDEQPGMRGNS